MSRKIVILNGSPREKGNTSALTAAFTEGAEKAGNSVTEFHLQDMNIGGCLGCYGGGKDPEHPCVVKDDMDLIYPVYKEADLVVLASPLYYWMVSGQLKTAVDRLFAVAEYDPNLKNPKKASLLIMAAEGYGFDESEYWYDHLVDHLHWKSLGKLLCGGVLKVGDVEDRSELGEARQIGERIG